MSDHSLRIQLARFSSLPLLSSLMPLLLLPVVARAASADEWVGLALGQSAGTVSAIGVSYGWSLIGPPLATKANDETRRRIYKYSLRGRLRALAIWLPLAGSAAYAIAPEGGEPIAVTMAAAVSIGGLSPVWFNVGVGDARSIAVYDIAPRAATAGLALVLVAATGLVIWFPVLLAVGTLGGVIAFSIVRQIASAEVPAGWSNSELPSRGVLTGAMLTELAASAYSVGAISLIAVSAPADDMDSLASAFRLLGIALYSVTALSQTLQAWVVGGAGASLFRMRRALIGHGSLGALGFLAFATGAPLASELMFGFSLRIPQSFGVLFGIAFWCIALSTSLTRHVLIPRGQGARVLSATLIGAVCGTLMIVEFSSRYGTLGGAAAFCASEVLVTAILAGLAWRSLNGSGVRVS